MSEKYCPGCEAMVDEKDFHRNRCHKQGLQVYCKIHQDEFIQDWRERQNSGPVNPERYRGLLASIVQQYRSGA